MIFRLKARRKSPQRGSEAIIGQLFEYPRSSILKVSLFYTMRRIASREFFAGRASRCGKEGGKCSGNYNIIFRKSVLTKLKRYDIIEVMLI